MRYLFLFLTFITLNAFAQKDEAGVRKAVEDLFKGMKTSDTALIRSAFSANPLLQTITRNNHGGTAVTSEVLDSFLVIIGRPHKEFYDERITFEALKID